MMEKERSRGVTIFGWIFIILGILPLLMVTYALVRYKYYNTLVASYKSFAILILVYTIGYGVLLLVFGIGLLGLKELARKGVLIFSCIISAVSFVILIIAIVLVMVDWIPNAIFKLATFVPAFYFFSRPKVKEQFK